MVYPGDYYEFTTTRADVEAPTRSGGRSPVPAGAGGAILFIEPELYPGAHLPLRALLHHNVLEPGALPER